MPTVSIVIRALNEAEHLPALFSGLLRQTRQPDQVILVDSGSVDDTVAIARAHGAEVVHIAPAEFSFGRALNLGCAAASGDIFVIVSAHVYPLDEKWLDLMVAPFERPEVGLVYGGQTGDSRSHFSELELLRTWFPDVSDDDQQTPFCNNANCAVRAEAWRALPYDETLTGLEDLDWAKRALAAGWKLVYAGRGPGRPHPQRAVRQDAQPLPARGDRPSADLPRPARQPVRGARAVPAVDRPRLPRRRCPPAAVVEPGVDPQVPCRPVPRHVGGVPPPRRGLDVAAPALLLPEGVHRPRPVLADRAMSLVGRRLRPDAPQQRAGAGQELPPVQRRPAVPPHRVDAARRRPDHQGGHRHRQPDRQGAGRRRLPVGRWSSTVPPTCSAATCR